MSPTRSKQHIIDEKGIQVIESFFLDKGWVVRRQDKDYGIDLEVEIVKDGLVTGRLFKVQVKSHENVQFNNMLYTEYIPIEHWAYWRNFALPVLLFVVDTSNNKIYWEGAIKGARRSFRNGLKSIPFRLSEDSELVSSLSLEELLYLIDNYKELKDYKEIVRFTLKKFDSFLMLYERIHCSDSFLYIDEYAEALVKHFDHVARFPNYSLSKKYMPICEAFSQMIQKIELSYIEFHRAIPICDAVFNYYYEFIESIIMTVIVLESEYWENVDSTFYEMVKSINLPKTRNEKDVLEFFVDNYDRLEGSAYA
ncbi:MAG: DUF4365 domain-containing protein [Desulfosporosinus sp.]|nr:DUF4365 domain-containing protein [Desulfosporosinus sp.]